ncbi:hypothetical protein GCM10020216_051240 [Nonomuraea helvata]
MGRLSVRMREHPYLPRGIPMVHEAGESDMNVAEGAHSTGSVALTGMRLTLRLGVRLRHSVRMASHPVRGKP